MEEWAQVKLERNEHTGSLPRDSSKKKIHTGKRCCSCQIERADLHKGVTCTTLMQIAETLNVPVCVILAQEPCQKYLGCLNEAAINMSIPTDANN